MKRIVVLLLRQGDFVFWNSTKNAGDYRKQVKASSPFGGCPRKTSDGRADRCAVLVEHAMFLRDSPVFAAF